jgi:hypothetical protein
MKAENEEEEEEEDVEMDGIEESEAGMHEFEDKPGFYGSVPILCEDDENESAVRVACMHMCVCACVHAYVRTCIQLKLQNEERHAHMNGEKGTLLREPLLYTYMVKMQRTSRLSMPICKCANS